MAKKLTKKMPKKIQIHRGEFSKNLIHEVIGESEQQIGENGPVKKCYELKCSYGRHFIAKDSKYCVIIE